MKHPYLRAYMAGIAFPTIYLPVMFLVVWLTGQMPTDMGPFLIFPMAVVPNAFGLWNMLFLAMNSRWHHPIGLHGAVLPLFLGPLGLTVGIWHGVVRVVDGSLLYFNEVRVYTSFLVVMLPIAFLVYYLVWKYIVGWLNGVLQLPR